MSPVIRICFGALVVGALLHFLAATIDNDVLGVFKLSYTPHHLAARVIVAVSDLLSIPALLVLCALGLAWGVRRMAA